MNVFSPFENAALAWKDKPAVRYGARRQTYGELSDLASAFVSRLASLGLHRGDRVAIFMRNGFLYPSALLGALRGGFVAVPINAKLHPREAAYIVDNAEAKAIVLDADVATDFPAVHSDRRLIRSSLVIPPHKMRWRLRFSQDPRRRRRRRSARPCRTEAGCI
jgi:acyl-CoA synthetase (AMP-forming)/AMP-acid ligase II